LRAPRLVLSGSNIARARSGLDLVGVLFETKTEELGRLNTNEQQFLQDARRATTDEAVRERRTTFLIDLMR
jgi:hypothetical protein